MLILSHWNVIDSTLLINYVQHHPFIIHDDYKEVDFFAPFPQEESDVNAFLYIGMTLDGFHLTIHLSELDVLIINFP